MANKGLKTIKRFTYRGQLEEWSNLYHFSDALPADAAAWRTLVDAFVAEEKKIFSNMTNIVRAYGYDDTDHPAIFTVDYAALSINNVGTFVPSSGPPLPGDVAATVRWATTKVNSRGRKVYLRKYYHDVYENSGGDRDTLNSSQQGLMQAFAGKLSSGSLTGATFTLCGPDGTDAGAAAVNPYLTTRTLKRRGKRPPT